jgi:hypothetical protein
MNQIRSNSTNGKNDKEIEDILVHHRKLIEQMINLDASSFEHCKKLVEIKMDCTKLLSNILERISTTQRKMVKKMQFTVMERDVLELEKLLLKVQSMANFPTNFKVSLLELERRRQWKISVMLVIQHMFQEEYDKRRLFKQLVGKFMGNSALSNLLSHMPVIDEENALIRIEKFPEMCDIGMDELINHLGGDNKLTEIGLDPSLYKNLHGSPSSSLELSLNSSLFGSNVSKMSHIANQIETLISQRSALERKTFQLQLRNEELQEQQTECQEQLQQQKLLFAQQFQDKLQEVTTLKEELNKLKTENTTLRESINVFGQRNDQTNHLQQELLATQTRERQASQYAKQTQYENTQLKQELQQVVARMNSMNQTNSDQQRAIAEFTQKLQKTTEDLEAEQVKNQRLSKQQKMVAQLFSQNEQKLLGQIQNLETSLALLQKDNNTYSSMVKDMNELQHRRDTLQIVLYDCIDKFQEMSSWLFLSTEWEQLDKMKRSQEFENLEPIVRQIWKTLAAILEKKVRS